MLSIQDQFRRRDAEKLHLSKSSRIRGGLDEDPDSEEEEEDEEEEMEIPMVGVHTCHIE